MTQYRLLPFGLPAANKGSQTNYLRMNDFEGDISSFDAECVLAIQEAEENSDCKGCRMDDIDSECVVAS